MREIYEKARKVQIWLGSADNETKQAFGTIQRLAHFTGEYERQGQPWASFTNHFVNHYGAIPGQWRYESVPFVRLLARQWFLRVWTLQEVVVGPLAKRIVLVCGNLRCWFDDLAQVCVRWRQAGMMPYVLAPQHPLLEQRAKLAITQLGAIRQMRYGVQGNRRLDTLGLLKASRIREATDPRDKIFGLIGLTIDRNNDALKPDYSIKTSTAYERFAINHYRTTKSFALFSACCLKKSSLPELDSLPSWVPDWSQCIEHDTLGATYREYHAGGPETQNVRFTESDTVLNVTGVIVDYVSHLGIGIRREGDPMKGFPNLFANFAQWLDMSGNADYYPEKSTLPPQEDIWRCLICDMDIAGHAAPSVYGEYFQQYVRYMHCLKDWWTRYGSGRGPPPPDEVARQIGQRSLDGVNLYENSILQWAGTRKFCVTEYGRIGWVPPEAEVGDIVCIFKGAATPHLLRMNDDGHLILVGGACYIHGQMEGEAMQNAEEYIQEFAIY